MDVVWRDVQLEFCVSNLVICMLCLTECVCMFFDRGYLKCVTRLFVYCRRHTYSLHTQSSFRATITCSVVCVYID